MAEVSSGRETTEHRSPDRQRLLPIAGASPTVRCCLLSGGTSRRMGRDKALLPHPDGGTWLSRSLQLLAKLDAPITLLSRWPAHLALAEALALPNLSAIPEPPPWEGPLLALHRLMELHPDERLLLCPVDMPWLTLDALTTLRRAGMDDQQRIQLADDGSRCQPLLAFYPVDGAIRNSLAAEIASGQRRLQGWLAGQPCRRVGMDAAALHNVNRTEELDDHNQCWG